MTNNRRAGLKPQHVVNGAGVVPAFPLIPCRNCSDPTCDRAVDQNGSLVFERSVYMSSPSFRYMQGALSWKDILNEPGWNNGWPPGMGPGFNFIGIDPSDEVIEMTAKRVTRKCDCGAAAADYTISRDGGPGHSDWCKVYEKMA